MDSAKEIHDRIKSVQGTKKITTAMYLISSNKLRKAKRKLDETRPYFDMLRGGIKKIFDNIPEASSQYMDVDNKRPDSEKVRGYLVVTADKGLAGAYNHNVLKLAQEHLRDSKQVKLYVVGEFGRQYFRQKGIPVEHSFLYTAQNPNLYRAGELASVLLDAYISKEVDEIYVIYTNMKDSINTEVKMRRLLPFERDHFSGLPADDEYSQFEFYPSVDRVINRIVRSYLSGYIYSVLVDSYCSEQSARMAAMDAASRNADEMLRSLSLRYNSVRQAAITQEITEVAAGARAQKLRKINIRGTL